MISIRKDRVVRFYKETLYVYRLQNEELILVFSMGLDVPPDILLALDKFYLYNQNGSLLIYYYDTHQYEELSVIEKPTCIYAYEDNFVVGTNGGSIKCFQFIENSDNLISDIDPLTSLDIEPARVVRILGSEIKHSSPVKSVVKIGDWVYVLDITNLVSCYNGCTFICRYDFDAKFLIFSKYLFVVESNRLYCKSGEEFTMYLETVTAIDSVTFSSNGACAFFCSIEQSTQRVTLFVQLKYSSTFALPTQWVFDEDNNQFIYFLGKEPRYVKGVIKEEDLYAELDDIAQTNANIEKVHCTLKPFVEGEKATNIERTHSLFLSGTKRNGAGSSPSKKKAALFLDEASSETASIESEMNNDSCLSVNADYLRIEENPVNSHSTKIHTHCSGRIKKPLKFHDSLICTNRSRLYYNSVGYISFHEGSTLACYHDISMMPFAYEGFAVSGCVSKRGIVLLTHENLILYDPISGGSDYIENVSYDFICCNEQFILAKKADVIHIYGWCKLFIGEFVIYNVLSICVNNNLFYIFTHDCLVELSENLELKRILLPKDYAENVTFFCVSGTETTVLYVGKGSVLHEIYEGTCLIKACDYTEFPCYVYNNQLITTEGTIDTYVHTNRIDLLRTSPLFKVGDARLVEMIGEFISKDLIDQARTLFFLLKDNTYKTYWRGVLHFADSLDDVRNIPGCASHMSDTSPTQFCFEEEVSKLKFQEYENIDTSIIQPVDSLLHLELEKGLRNDTTHVDLGDNPPVSNGNLKKKIDVFKHYR